MKIGRSGVNKLSTMMKNISSEAALSHIYTKHSVRATTINLWANSGLTNREIMAISGHGNESNVQSYHSIPSVKQLRRCSEVICTALGHDDTVAHKCHAENHESRHNTTSSRHNTAETHGTTQPKITAEVD